MRATSSGLDYYPVTSSRLADLDRFSEEHGKFCYCSCMRWRMTSTEFRGSSKAERVAALQQLVRVGSPVGVLAYLNGDPVGWCSVAPRATYRGLERYRALARIDPAPVWSVACFFLDRSIRRSGATLELLSAATHHAISQGAEIVEGYPVIPGARLYTYMGSAATFLRAGFEDVTPEGRQRLVMRYVAHKSHS
ncbi:MAG: GNAT family N-acetyltransferase [Chloroflexi bacterium]|nr:GNAT family N-acetyltransferase [Chloroflexota bacterium]